MENYFIHNKKDLTHLQAKLAVVLLPFTLLFSTILTLAKFTGQDILILNFLLGTLSGRLITIAFLVISTMIIFIFILKLTGGGYSNGKYKFAPLSKFFEDLYF